MSAHHGNTPAAWTLTCIVLVGFAIGGVGLMVDYFPLFWAGVACVPLGAVVGGVMRAAGMGAVARNHGEATTAPSAEPAGARQRAAEEPPGQPRIIRS